jgi:hypothetical protein
MNLAASWYSKVVPTCGSAYIVTVKHFLPTLTLLLALLSSVGPARPLRPAPAHPTETVYVCMSQTSYAYHRSDSCQGLNRCSHPLEAMPTV